MKHTNIVQYVFPYILEFLRSRLYTFPKVHSEKPKTVFPKINIVHHYKQNDVLHSIWNLSNTNIYIVFYNEIPQSNKTFKHKSIY